MKHADSVIQLGHLEREELSKVLGAALAMVYPSFFEGFGIPLLEAMYAEIPIITSTTSSLPEVAGDAAILINPNK
jgi:glycosyltransferase involved in cell wall biosynthesis